MLIQTQKTFNAVLHDTVPELTTLEAVGQCLQANINSDENSMAGLNNNVNHRNMRSTVTNVLD